MPPNNTIDTGQAGTYNQFDVDRIVDLAVRNAITQYESRRSNLENCTGSELPDERKGETPMSSKFREKVKVSCDESGSPIYKWACGNTKEELNESIFNLLSEARASQRSQEVAKRVLLWEEYADNWFNVFHVNKVRAKTLAKDTSLFKNHIRPAFAGIPIDKITPAAVQEYLRTKSSYCQSQVRDIMSMLKGVFDYAVDDDAIVRNPMHSRQVFNSSTKADRPRKALLPAEQADIIAHLDDLRDVRDRYGDSLNALRFMALLMFTCLRPCEIYGLRWEDIDVERMTISVKRDLVFVSNKGIIGDTKTPESAREVPFDEALLNYLKPIEASGFVLHLTAPGKTDEHFTEQAARNMWKRIIKTIDVHGMTPYVGRHTFATNMSRSGVPMRTAISMMGHKDERMLLRRYTHTYEQDLIDATKSVSSYLSNICQSQNGC